MSGFASSIILSGKVFTPPEVRPVEQEAAGKVGKALGVIAAIVIPFAAPAIWGAIATSTAIGSSLAGAMTGVFGATVTNIVGSAVIGGAMNVVAGGSFAQGALSGGLGAGTGMLSRGLSGSANAAGGVAKAGVNAVGGTGPVALAPGVGGAAGSYGVTNAAAGLNAATATAGGVQSTGVMGTIRNIFSGASGVDLNRIGAAIVNAAVNGQNMGELNGLVAQQRAELDALRAQDEAQYNLRIQAAQQILNDADRQDPSWLARVRMADVAGMEANQFRQAMRNIATTQGGSLDQGQRKAYERAASLHTARSKALAWGRGWGEGVQNQASLRGQGAGLLTSPNYAGWQSDTDLEAGAAQARAHYRGNTAGVFADAIFGSGTYNPTTSPAPADQEQNEDDAFTAGRNWPRG